MPRSCPPLRSDEVGWHGRRVRTRLRLILERVFWFVNGGMSVRSPIGVGDDGCCGCALPCTSPQAGLTPAATGGRTVFWFVKGWVADLGGP